MAELDTIEKLVSIATDVGQAVAVIVAAWIGARGLNAWRQQLMGGKRIDLAEDALVAAHEVCNVLPAIRQPMASVGEGSSRKPQDGETENQTRMRNGYYVPIERLIAAADRFDKLVALRTRCKIHFGDEVAPYFDALLSARHRIMVASRMLIMTAGRGHPRTPEQAEEQQKRVERWESVIWDMGSPAEPDEFFRERLQALIALEKVLKPHLKDR